MKYMTFNSSCAYAGVANMLELYGMNTDDMSIAMDMKLPYLFSYEDGVYMAGPMLQSAEWFNLYLHPIGFDMTEKGVLAAQVPEYLKQQRTAMLGLQVDESGKHAVVYIGTHEEELVFLNNKWEHTNAPEEIRLTEEELINQLGTSAMIATLKQIPSQAVDLTSRLISSQTVIRQNLEEIQAICSREETVRVLRLKLNTLFRPLFLDGITMLGLIGETELAQQFTGLQRRVLFALKQKPDEEITLGRYLNMEVLADSVGEYILLIKQAI